MRSLGTTILHLGAALAAVSLLVIESWSLTGLGVTDPGLASGKWAVRFLLLCLAMSPLRTYFGWNGANRLRRPAGLWSFGFASLHVLLTLREWGWGFISLPVPPYLLLGLGAFIILTLLALTSNRLAMNLLKKGWKRLHRLVYCAAVGVAGHGMLAVGASKKMALEDPEVLRELHAYAALFAVLLLIRIPHLRELLLKAKRAVELLIKRREPKESTVPIREILLRSDGPARRQSPQHMPLGLLPLAPPEEVSRMRIEEGGGHHERSAPRA